MKFNPAILLRGFALLVVVFILLVAAFQFLPQPSPVQIQEAAIATGVAATQTAALAQVSTANPTQIQSTVAASIDATLNAPTPTPLSPSEEISQGAEGILGWIWGIIMAIWNFMGFGGIYTQICCCLLPFALIVMGAASDKARPR